MCKLLAYFTVFCFIMAIVLVYFHLNLIIGIPVALFAAALLFYYEALLISKK